VNAILCPQGKRLLCVVAKFMTEGGSMATKLVLIVSLLVFLCCVAFAPAAPSLGDVSGITRLADSQMFGSFLAGSALENLCGFAGEGGCLITWTAPEVLRQTQVVVESGGYAQMQALLLRDKTGVVRTSHVGTP
jgi:hypothetical protein